MNELIAALLVPIIMGVVQLGRGAGLHAKACAPLAAALGVAGMLGVSLADALGGRELYVTILQGLGVGLSASGLFSVTRSVAYGAAALAEPEPPPAAPKG